jgi:hypothetical protein
MKPFPSIPTRSRHAALVLLGAAALLLAACAGEDYSSYRSDDMYESVGGYHYSGSVYGGWGYGGYYGGYGGGGVAIGVGGW